jgi:hypothetical protein
VAHATSTVSLRTPSFVCCRRAPQHDQHTAHGEWSAVAVAVVMGASSPGRLALSAQNWGHSAHHQLRQHATLRHPVLAHPRRHAVAGACWCRPTRGLAPPGGPGGTLRSLAAAPTSCECRVQCCSACRARARQLRASCSLLGPCSAQQPVAAASASNGRCSCAPGSQQQQRPCRVRAPVGSHPHVLSRRATNALPTPSTVHTNATRPATHH